MEESQEKKRRGNKNWKKGVSANPGGKPRGKLDWRTTVKRAIATHIDAAAVAKNLVELAVAGDKPAMRGLLDILTDAAHQSEIDRLSASLKQASRRIDELERKINSNEINKLTPNSD